MSKKPKFYRDGINNVVEFEDGVKLHISRNNLTEQELLMLEALKGLVTPISLSIGDVQAKIEEIKKAVVKTVG